MSARLSRIARYLATGAIGLVVNLGSYHLLVAFARISYLPGSMIAIALSTVVGFLLQKYWTFGERSHATAPRQFALYAALALWNLGLNTLIVFALVEYFALHYLIAQTIGAGVVAVSSFFAYHYYIFAHSTPQSEASGASRQS